MGLLRLDRPAVGENGGGGIMKSFIYYALFFAFAAEASGECVNLTGEYLCKSKWGEIKMSISQTMGPRSFQIDSGTVYILDETYRTSDRGAYLGSCDREKVRVVKPHFERADGTTTAGIFDTVSQADGGIEVVESRGLIRGEDIGSVVIEREKERIGCFRQ